MDIISELQNKKNNEAYQLMIQLEIKSTESNQYYKYFDDFIKLLDHKNSFVRVRGFRLACAQAQWDIENKIENNIDKLLKLLNDNKATTVRQCFTALHLVILYKPELNEIIKNKLDTIDLSIYKDSMIPLIEKDREEIYKALDCIV